VMVARPVCATSTPSPMSSAALAFLICSSTAAAMSRVTGKPATVVQFWAGRRFYVAAWRAGRHGSLTMDTLVVIGIGGSLLGAQAVHAALDGLESSKRGARSLKLVFAGDATDPRAVRDVIDAIDWKRAAINVISKSGDTIEPMSVFVLLRDRLVKAVGRKKAAERVIATTDPEKGTLRAIADREGYATLPVPGNVGGRFSVFTEVGAFPLLAAGINVEELWKGAAAEDAAFWKTSPTKNVALVSPWTPPM